MTDSPSRFHPSGDHKLKPAQRRQYRLSDDHSPTRGRLHDELLSQLTPMSAVDVLQHPTPALKACLDAATANEQDFVMRTAVASQSIYEWLDELSEWPWPSTPGSEGFELPFPKRRKLFSTESPTNEDLSSRYTGSLPTEDVLRYETRLADISYGLNDLDIDDIKTHVLHNHILPLSRPGTPLSDSNRSLLSPISFNRLDDLAACITAIIMQALPNLSRLNRLLNVWSARLLVLRKVPAVLAGIVDAELALHSGWNVISPTKNALDGDDDESAPRGLTQKDFDVMKQVLSKKLTKPGRDLDFMLDALEGMQDTLPESWLDRMEAVEQGYADWHVACERKIRETAWAAARPKQREATTPPLEPQTPAKANGSPTPATPPAPTERVDEDQQVESTPSVNITVEPPEGLSSSVNSFVAAEDTERQAPETPHVPQTPATKPKGLTASGLPEILSPPSTTGPLSHRVNLRTPASLHQRGFSSYDGSEDMDPVKSDLPTPFTGVSQQQQQYLETPSTQRIVSETVDDDTVIFGNDSCVPGQLSLNELIDSDSDIPQTPGASDGEMDLPPLIHQDRRASDTVSCPSTVVHEPSSRIITSDAPEVSASPPLPRDKFSHAQKPELLESPILDSVEMPAAVAEADAPIIEGDSIVRRLSSSPPFSHSFREDSLGPWDVQDDESMFRSSVNSNPFSSSFVEEDTEDTSTLPNIDEASEYGQDEQLHQQIHNILESIPAKIKLADSPRKVNLNPPPLELPVQRGKKPSKDPFRRSASGLSSRASTRASTPSWLLAPAKNTRPQRQRGQQETRVYHFSRSTGEAPIKLLIRCVGEHGERVMVRVGGGWADLGEYLKDYAVRHGRRTQNADTSKIEIQDLPRVAASRANTTSPPTRPASALEHSPITPLQIRKTRRSFGAAAAPEHHRPGPSRPVPPPKTPGPPEDDKDDDTPPSDSSARSRSSSRLSWTEEDSFLGLAGPTGRKVEMSEESRAWVESVKEKVRLASGERKPPPPEEGRFGELGKVGGTKRLFRKG